MFKIDPRYERFLYVGEPAGGGGGTPTGGDPPAGDPPAGDPPKPPDWYEGLPDDLKGEKSISAYKGKPLTDLVTSHRDLSNKIGDTAPPAKPEDYGIALPAVFDEHAKDPATKERLEGTLKGMLATAHAAGMPKAVAQAFVEHEAKVALADLEENGKKITAAEKVLKEKWGDKYDENVAYTERAIATLPEDLKKIIEEVGIGNHPHFIELIFRLGEAQAEGRLHRGDAGTGKKSLEDRLYPGTAQ